MERFNTPLTKEAAKSLLALDLEDKVITSYEKLDEWYTAWGGQCYVSFSGGKDSTVLAYLAARYLSSFRTPPWPRTCAWAPFSSPCSMNPTRETAHELTPPTFRSCTGIFLHFYRGIPRVNAVPISHLD